MSAPAFEGLVQLIRPGVRCHLGMWAGGGYAIWLVTGGPTAATFPVASSDPMAAHVAWDAASRTFASWEAPPWGQPAVVYERDGRAAGGVVLVLVVLAVVYWLAHTVVYRHCVFTPGLFSWPSACL